MKKILNASVLMLAVTLLFTACSGTRSVVTGNTVSRSKFTGTWTLNTVSYEGLVPGSVQNVFDQAAPNAFVGSIWKLTNSGNGIYTLANGTSQTIFWSVYNGNQFQFKKIYQGDKASQVTDGYRLDIAGNDGASMTLKSPVNIGDQTGYVVYNFTKSQ